MNTNNAISTLLVADEEEGSADAFTKCAPLGHWSLDGALFGIQFVNYTNHCDLTDETC